MLAAQRRSRQRNISALSPFSRRSGEKRGTSQSLGPDGHFYISSRSRFLLQCVKEKEADIPYREDSSINKQKLLLKCFVFKKALAARRTSTLIRTFVLLMLVMFFPTDALSGMLFQQFYSYQVVPGDTLITIGAKLGVDWGEAAKDNGLDPSHALSSGSKLRIRVSEIIPETVTTGMIIDIPGRMLYFFEGGVPLMAVPAGVGMPKKEGKKGWETPEGRFTVKRKLKNPDWAVPDSIQEEMRREGLSVKERYPPGPKNPVGGYVLQTTLPGILIHETIDPSSAYRSVSHGCVRILREDMVRLFESASSGMSGKIVYKPIKMAELSDGKVFIEVNKDVYGKLGDMQSTARTILKKAGLLRRVDMSKVEKAVQDRTGIPVEVSK